ncbi:MAG: hypothetical protein AAF674_08580 [Pseudomonadota bacterium]
MPRLIDDAFGRIQHILLTIPDFAVDEFAPALQSVIRALPAHANIDVLAGPAHDAAVNDWVRTYPNIRVHRCRQDLDHSHWAQDAVGGATNADRPVLFWSKRFARHDDARAGAHLAALAGYPLHAIDAPYDGGNVLVQGDLILAGADLGPPEDLDPTRRMIVIGTQEPCPPEAQVPTKLLPKGWQEIRRSGVEAGSQQPLFHLDLFLAPAGLGANGRPRWLVGCPRLGAAALGIALLDHAGAEAFDEIAEVLRRNGCDVVRNPQPLVWSDQPTAKLRTWFHLPVNNVLVEIRADRSTVWLPCFQSETWPELAAIDAANAVIWQDLGFSVVKVPDCMALAERRGAVRCMCNVVSRAG